MTIFYIKVKRQRTNTNTLGKSYEQNQDYLDSHDDDCHDLRHNVVLNLQWNLHFTTTYHL